MCIKICAICEVAEREPLCWLVFYAVTLPCVLLHRRSCSSNVHNVVLDSSSLMPHPCVSSNTNTSCCLPLLISCNICFASRSIRALMLAWLATIANPVNPCCAACSCRACCRRNSVTLLSVVLEYPFSIAPSTYGR